jgi:hypothetical protein
MTEKLTALLHEAERLEAVQACRNLMGKYSYYHTAFRNLEYVELWAKRDDTMLTMPFGIFDGWEGVRRCYVEMHGDRSIPEDAEQLKGLMMVHAMDTEVIEVAADGMTAKAAFISPGHETAPTPGKEKGAWCWGKYEVDFIKEDGVWKFWHMVLYPVFLTPVDRSWGMPTLDELDGPKETPNMPCDRSLEKPFWEYNKDAVYPFDEPRLPLPYETF